MARLENATYDKIVTHMKCRLQINVLDERDDRHTSPNNVYRSKILQPGSGFLSSSIDPSSTSNYGKKLRQVKDDCRRLKRNERQTVKKQYPKTRTSYKTNHPARRCWNGACAQLKTKNLNLEVSKTDDASTSPTDARSKPTNSILNNPEN